MDLTLASGSGHTAVCHATVFAETDREAREDGRGLGESLCCGTGYVLTRLEVSLAAEPRSTAPPDRHLAG